MYLKILARDDDKTNILTGIRSVEFFHLASNEEEIRKQLNCADLALVANELAQTKYEKSEDIVRVGCFNVTDESGKGKYIIFDGVAFLCNERGKAVERYLAN